MNEQHRRQESNLRASGSEPDATTNSCYSGVLICVWDKLPACHSRTALTGKMPIPQARAEGVEPSYHCFKGSWLTVSRHPNIIHQTECHVGVEPT